MSASLKQCVFYALIHYKVLSKRQHVSLLESKREKFPMFSLLDCC